MIFVNHLCIFVFLCLWRTEMARDAVSPANRIGTEPAPPLLTPPQQLLFKLRRPLGQLQMERCAFLVIQYRVTSNNALTCFCERQSHEGGTSQNVAYCSLANIEP